MYISSRWKYTHRYESFLVTILLRQFCMYVRINTSPIEISQKRVSTLIDSKFSGHNSIRQYRSIPISSNHAD